MAKNREQKRKRAALPPLPPLDPLQRYPIPEASRYLRLSRASIYNRINDGSLQVIRDGKMVYIPGAEIARRSTLQPAA